MHFVKAKGILSARNGMNLYRGCTHGCVYCDSRSLCYHIDHDFADVEVKENAPELLEAALSRKRRKCMIATGSMCDPYLHAEADLRLTRRCFEIVDRLGFGLTVITKSRLVLRDLDLFKSINHKAKCVVQMTLTTYNENLRSILEPDVSSTRERFEALCTFRDAGIPTVVWLCPILPFINDTEENIRGILDYCVKAGVWGILCFGMGLTLREGDREYYYRKLDEYFPGIKDMYRRKYGDSYVVTSDRHDELMTVFEDTCESHGIEHDTAKIFAYLSEFPQDRTIRQLDLFRGA